MTRINFPSGINPEHHTMKALRNVSSAEMNVLGTLGTPVPFSYVVPADFRAVFTRLTVELLDATVDPGIFGGIGVLANGLEITTRTAADAEIVDYTDGLNIRRNGDWALLAGIDSEPDTAVGPNPDLWSVRWTFSKSFTEPMELTAGQSFRILVQDDLTTLDLFHCMLQGLLLPV